MKYDPWLRVNNIDMHGTNSIDCILFVVVVVVGGWRGDNDCRTATQPYGLEET